MAGVVLLLLLPVSELILDSCNHTFMRKYIYGVQGGESPFRGSNESIVVIAVVVVIVKFV